MHIEQPDLKHAQVKEKLRDEIARHYPPGAKIPSTVTLHRALGVSPGTINRALRDLVDEGLLERVKSRGTFVTDGKPQEIGLLWPSSLTSLTAGEYPDALLHAIEREARRDNINLLVRGVQDWGKPKFLDRTGPAVGGVLILFNYDHGLVEAYHKYNVPVVLVDPLVRDLDTPFVTADHFSALRAATRHLIALGHQRIVHVTVQFPTFSIPMEERVLGYAEAMQTAGLGQFRHVHYLTDSIDISEVAQAGESPAITAFLAMLSQVQPTACCCWDDSVAAWVIHVCHAHGIQVPEELSVVGVNDTGLAQHLWPPLTSIGQPTEAIARTALDMLLAMRAKRRLHGGGQVLPVRLVKRASTAPASDALTDVCLQEESLSTSY